MANLESRATRHNFEEDFSSEYQKRLQLHLYENLRSSPQSLTELIRKAGGAYPTDVKLALDQLVLLGMLEIRGDAFSLLEPDQNHAETPSLPFSERGVRRRNRDSVLPPPHPADYDWRFTERSRSKLIENIEYHLTTTSRIGLLGTPTLYLALRDSRHEVTLFDRNNFILDRLRRLGADPSNLVQADLFNPLPSGFSDYDLIIADPPWYVDYYEAFLLRASQLLRMHGILLLSVLPWLTRPTAIEDRKKILQFSAAIGMDLAQSTEDVLDYELPSFEQRALEHKGINLSQWRRGDLFVFRLTAKNLGNMVSLKELDAEWHWHSFEIGPTIVKVRSQNERCSGPFSYAIVGSPLATVSRRFPLRDRINVWTSDNRAYSVQGLDIIRRTLFLREKGSSPTEAIKVVAEEESLASTEVLALTDLLQDLLRTEDLEFLESKT